MILSSVTTAFNLAASVFDLCRIFFQQIICSAYTINSRKYDNGIVESKSIEYTTQLIWLCAGHWLQPYASIRVRFLEFKWIVVVVGGGDGGGFSVSVLRWLLFGDLMVFHSKNLHWCHVERCHCLWLSSGCRIIIIVAEWTPNARLESVLWRERMLLA